MKARFGLNASHFWALICILWFLSDKPKIQHSLKRN